MFATAWIAVTNQVIARMDDWIEDLYSNNVEYGLDLGSEILTQSNGPTTAAKTIANALSAGVAGPENKVPSRDLIPLIKNPLINPGANGADSSNGFWDVAIAISDALVNTLSSPSVKTLASGIAVALTSDLFSNTSELTESETVVNFDGIFRGSYPSYGSSTMTDAQMVADRDKIEDQIAKLTLLKAELNKRAKQLERRYFNLHGGPLRDQPELSYQEAGRPIREFLTRVTNAICAALEAEYDLVHTVNSRREAEYVATVKKLDLRGSRGISSGKLMRQSILDANVEYYTREIAIEVITIGLGEAALLRHLNKAKLAAKVSDDVTRYVDNVVGVVDDARVSGPTSWVGDPRVFTRTVDFTPSTGRTYKVFQRNDINWDQVRTGGARDFVGKTNAEAARVGLRPELPDGRFATLHHSQQSAVGPWFEASTHYHNIRNAKKAPLHPWTGSQHPDYPLGRGPGSLREQFQTIESPEYWIWREANK